MRLSWNEVRARAAAFAGDWRDASYEKGESQSFYNDFFAVFGVQRRSVARYEEHVTKPGDRSGYIDLFWPGVLIVEQKSAGRDLEQAYGQAGEYFDALPERDRPRYILVSNFRTRRWPTSTTRTPCLRGYAAPTAPTAPSTGPWTASTAARASPPSASASSTCSCSTRRCAHRSKRG